MALLLGAHKDEPSMRLQKMIYTTCAAVWKTWPVRSEVGPGSLGPLICMRASKGPWQLQAVTRNW